MEKCLAKYYIENGKILPVSIENEIDISLSTGKIIYEVIRFIDGIPLFWADHIERLFQSAKIANLEIWIRSSAIFEFIGKLIKVNKLQNANAKLIFQFPADNSVAENRFIFYFIPSHYPDNELYNIGVKTGFYKAKRENPNAKIINFSLRSATNNIISSKNIFETILVDQHGFVTEGSRSNIFFISGNKIYTSFTEDVLPGITRKFVLEVCSQINLQVIEKHIHYTSISSYEAAFLSGTSLHVIPIAAIDNYIFEPKNDVFSKILNNFKILIDNYLRSNRNLFD